MVQNNLWYRGTAFCKTVRKLKGTSWLDKIYMSELWDCYAHKICERELCYETNKIVRQGMVLSV